MAADGTMSRSIIGVSEASSAMSSAERTRDEWTVAMMTGTAGGDGRPGAEHLGAVHVRMDEIDLLAPQPGRELADGDLVIHLVEHVHRHAEGPEALDRRAGRQRQGADVVAGSVQPQQEPGVRLLGAAVAAGREQLQHARARMAATDGCADGGCRRRRRSLPRGRAVSCGRCVTSRVDH